MQRKNETIAFTSTPATIAAQTSLCLVLILTGVLGNGIICFLMIRFKGLRTIPNILLTNLATVDLLNIIINAPLLILSQVYDLKTLYTKTAAWWMTFLSTLFVQLNVTTMLSLVLDRYLVLAYSFKYTLWRTSRKIFCTICLTWIWPVFFTGCIAIPFYNIELGTKSLYDYLIAYTSKNNARLYILSGNLCLLTPVILFSVLTIRKIWKESSVKIIANGAQNKNRKSAAIKSASTIMIVLLAYTVCFICGVSFCVIGVSSDENRQWFIFVGRYIMLCGSSCNSFIYAARSKFRNALRQTFKRIKCFQNKIHHQQKEGVVFYINGQFGKQQIRINNSVLDGIQGHLEVQPI